MVGQTAPEQPVAQPVAVPTTERVAEDPTRDRADMSAPARGDGTVGTPPEKCEGRGEQGSISCSGGGATR